MNILYNTINRIESNLVRARAVLKDYSETELSQKPAPGKWSKKEILGHLCDSAVNNLGRFIRAQYEQEPFEIISYKQDEWVRLNHYNEMKMNDIIELWAKVNRQINHVISKIPEEKFAILSNHTGATYADPKSGKTLLWLFEDYLAHMEHHLKQLGINN